jgi:hypothetical protein
MLQSTVELVAFFFFIASCLYLPAKFFVKKLQIKLYPIEDIFFCTSLGILIFTLVSYILSWLKLEILILPILLIVDFFVIKEKHWLPGKIEKKHIYPFIVVIIFGTLFSLSMLSTGKFGDAIIYRHDDLWHIALINELKVNFPPDNPGIAGVPLKGYHFFYNFLQAKISNIFHISPLSLHFHLFPLLTAMLWAIGIYALMYKWSKSRATAMWAVFLTLFGGSFAYILQLQGHAEVDLNSGLGIWQLIGSLYNAPFSTSIVILLTALFALHEYISTRKTTWLIPLALCVGLIAMFKVYAGMILVGGFLVFVLVELIKKRFTIFIPLGIVGILFLTTYWIFAAGAGYLIFHPFWPPQTILQSFSWYGYDEKMYTFIQQGVIKGIIDTQVYGFTLFLFGNIGTKIVGIVLLPLLLLKKRAYPSYFAFIILMMTLISIVTPLLFLQSGKVFEIIQMSWYYLFFCSLFAAFGFSAFFKLKFHNALKIILFICIATATLPSAYHEYKSYLNSFNAPPNMLNPYFKTFAFLSQQGNYNSIVLEMPPKDVKPDEKELQWWYSNSDPAIVAFSNKRSYFNNEFNEYLGVNKKERFKFLKELIIFANTDPSSNNYAQSRKDIINKLRANDIHYIYSPYEIASFNNGEELRQIYKNPPYFIYILNY